MPLLVQQPGSQEPAPAKEKDNKKSWAPNDPNDENNPLYLTDEFRMFCFKVLPCSKRYCHEWTTCPFAHPAEKARRRDPRAYGYSGVACPDMKKTMVCPRGDSCNFAHNVFEYWLHPTRYRSQLCNDGLGCKRKVCFFAHTLQELRVPTIKPADGEATPAERDPFADASKSLRSASANSRNGSAQHQQQQGQQQQQQQPQQQQSGWPATLGQSDQQHASAAAVAAVAAAAVQQQAVVAAAALAEMQQLANVHKMMQAQLEAQQRRQQQQQQLDPKEAAMAQLVQAITQLGMVGGGGDQQQQDAAQLLLQHMLLQQQAQVVQQQLAALAPSAVGTGVGAGAGPLDSLLAGLLGQAAPAATPLPSMSVQQAALASLLSSPPAGHAQAHASPFGAVPSTPSSPLPQHAPQLGAHPGEGALASFRSTITEPGLCAPGFQSPSALQHSPLMNRATHSSYGGAQPMAIGGVPPMQQSELAEVTSLRHLGGLGSVSMPARRTSSLLPSSGHGAGLLGGLPTMQQASSLSPPHSLSHHQAASPASGNSNGGAKGSPLGHPVLSPRIIPVPLECGPAAGGGHSFFSSPRPVMMAGAAAPVSSPEVTATLSSTSDSDAVSHRSFNSMEDECTADVRLPGNLCL